MIAVAAPPCRGRGLMRRKTPLRVGPRVLPFLQCAATFRALVGGRGSGKTYGGVDAALVEAGREPSTGVVVAPTYSMVIDDVLPVFARRAREWCVGPDGEPHGSLVERFNRSELVATMTNGSHVLFRSASNAEHINRLRGLSASWIWFDEAGHMPHGEEAWKIGIATLREGGRMGRAWLTTTPRGKGWIYALFATAENPDYALFHAHTNDNPFTAGEYKKKIAEAYGVGQFARQELAGEFCDPEGTLFQREWFKIVDRAPEFTRLYRGWDLACSTQSAADYTVGVLIAITPDQDVYILDVARWKLEWPDSRRRIMALAAQDGERTTVGIESVAFQLVAIQELLREPAMARYAPRAVRAERDKLSHALPLAARAQAGKVYLVRAAWNAAYLDEVCAFTGNDRDAQHDDQVDGTTIAYRLATRPEPHMWVLE